MNNITKYELSKLYLDDELTMKQISQSVCISTGKIHRLIHEYCIPIRKTKHLTEEGRRRLSEAGKKKKGFRHTEESKMKMRESAKLHGIGHKKIRSDGYVAIYYPDYESANKDGYVMEHDYIMEQHIKRHLTNNECVHHINENRSDNRLENLQLMTKSDHMSYHSKKRHEKRKG